MILLKLRWLAVAALVAATPSLAPAATVILVEETGGGSFSQTYSLANLPTSINTGNFNDVKITINSSSTSGAQPAHSISTTLNAAPAAGFSTAIGLKVTVTDDGFLNSNPTGSGVFKGNVSNTSAFIEGSVTGSATLSSPATNLGPATATVGTSAPFAPVNVSGIPDQYSIQQVVDLRVTALNSGSATFTGAVSTQIEANVAVVPAPPAVILALAALPVLGLRRVLRKKA
jgi:hypothetical protein